MNWRPWIIAAFMIASAVVNGALLYFESEKLPELMNVGSDAARDDIKDRLVDLRFDLSERRENLRRMGFDDALIKVTVRKMKALDDQGARFKQMLRDFSDEVAPEICATTGLPQRYRMLSLLVSDESGERRVVEAGMVTSLEVQPWFGASLTQSVYELVELRPKPSEDSTLMGISSILLSQEAVLLENKTPFAYQSLTGIGWGYSGVKKKYKKADRRVSNYFALMHFLAEIANKDDGICQ